MLAILCFIFKPDVNHIHVLRSVLSQENVLLKEDLEACQKGAAINTEGEHTILDHAWTKT